MLVPLAALLVAMVSVQTGAALVKGLFPRVGVAGATTLRLALASVMLLAVWRPWRRLPKARETRSLLIYGVAMGVMNLCFYSALARIPLGIAVALEFSGPLAVAMAASHRAVDFAWVALAALGLVALLPLGLAHEPLSPAGIAFALAAGGCWALYIVFGQKAGSLHGGMTAALGTVIGALVIIPFGLAQAGAALLDPGLLPIACAVALLVERAAVFAGDVRAHAPADAHLRRAHERRAGARRALRLVLSARAPVARAVGGRREHHARNRGERDHESPRRPAHGVTRLSDEANGEVEERCTQERHHRGEELGVRVEALGNQIARADVEEKAAE